jgi:hypothetical protein
VGTVAVSRAAFPHRSVRVLTPFHPAPRRHQTMSMMGITFNIHALCFFAAHGLSGAASARVGHDLGGGRPAQAWLTVQVRACACVCVCVCVRVCACVCACAQGGAARVCMLQAAVRATPACVTRAHAPAPQVSVLLGTLVMCASSLLLLAARHQVRRRCVGPHPTHPCALPRLAAPRAAAPGGGGRSQVWFQNTRPPGGGGAAPPTLTTPRLPRRARVAATATPHAALANTPAVAPRHASHTQVGWLFSSEPGVVALTAQAIPPLAVSLIGARLREVAGGVVWRARVRGAGA